MYPVADSLNYMSTTLRSTLHVQGGLDVSGQLWS